MDVGDQRARRRFLWLAVGARLLGFALCVVIAGCARARPSLTDSDPAIRIPAIRMAGERKDRSAIPLLVKGLSDEDSAVRFYSIEALVRFSGTSFGYVFYAEPEKRAGAVDRWESWLKHQ